MRASIEAADGILIPVDKIQHLRLFMIGERYYLKALVLDGLGGYWKLLRGNYDNVTAVATANILGKQVR